MSAKSVDKQKEHFRKLADLFAQIELAVVQKHRVLGVGTDIQDVDTFLQQNGVSVSGASTLWSFIKQSDLVMLSPDEHHLIPKPTEKRGRQVGDGLYLIDGIRHK